MPVCYIFITVDTVDIVKNAGRMHGALSSRPERGKVVKFVNETSL